VSYVRPEDYDIKAQTGESRGEDAHAENPMSSAAAGSSASGGYEVADGLDHEVEHLRRRARQVPITTQATARAAAARSATGVVSWW
jgi:hypothetical protein